MALKQRARLGDRAIGRVTLTRNREPKSIGVKGFATSNGTNFDPDRLALEGANIGTNQVTKEEAHAR